MSWNPMSGPATYTTPPVTPGGSGVSRKSLMNLDATKMKSWCQNALKATNDQVQKVKDTYIAKPPPVENDPLETQRNHLSEIKRAYIAVLADVEASVKVIEAWKTKQDRVNELNTLLNSDTLGTSRQLGSLVFRYFENSANSIKHQEQQMFVVQRLIFDLRNRISLIQHVEKKLENRDKLYKKVQDETKKLQRARELGDARVGERRRKLEKTQEEFASATKEVAEDLASLINPSAPFISDAIQKLVHFQHTCFAVIDKNLSEVEELAVTVCGGFERTMADVEGYTPVIQDRASLMTKASSSVLTSATHPRSFVEEFNANYFGSEHGGDQRGSISLLNPHPPAGETKAPHHGSSKTIGLSEFVPVKDGGASGAGQFINNAPRSSDFIFE